jgi:hypothetical protein
MQIIRDLPSTQLINHPAISALVQQRIDDLGGDKFNATELGYFLVIEPGDSLDTISAQVSYNILANRSTGIRYDEVGFTPSFEFIEEFPSCFETVIILDDSGYGIDIFISKRTGVDPDLLAMCQRYATPGAF